MFKSLQVALVMAVSLCWASVHAEQARPPEPKPPAAVAAFDANSVRRRAAQLAEFRTLLADPDPTVRLLTMQEAIQTGDGMQRQMAIDAGLASNESAMLEQGLRGVVADTQQIVMEFVTADGKATVEGGVGNFKLKITEFDAVTGKLGGVSSCGGAGKWSGQIQGTVFSFNASDNWCSGTLGWNGESGDFRGRINIGRGESAWNRNAIWKPR